MPYTAEVAAIDAGTGITLAVNAGVGVAATEHSEACIAPRLDGCKTVAATKDSEARGADAAHACAGEGLTQHAVAAASRCRGRRLRRRALLLASPRTPLPLWLKPKTPLLLKR